jgi:hypothetical protein
MGLRKLAVNLIRGLAIRATAYKFQSKNITFSLNESFNAALNRFFFKLIFEGSVFSKLIAS